jgi:hypothetical protein
VRRTTCSVQLAVELRVLLAQLEGGRQDAGDLLALDQLLQPPVAVVRRPEVTQGLARPGQVVEVAALHGLLDLQVHPPGLVLDPGRGSTGTGAGVPLAAGPLRRLPRSFLALAHRHRF